MEPIMQDFAEVETTIEVCAFTLTVYSISTLYFSMKCVSVY